MVENMLAEVEKQLGALYRKIEDLEASLAELKQWVAIEEYRRSAVLLSKTDVVRSLLVWLFIFISGVGTGDLVTRIK